MPNDIRPPRRNAATRRTEPSNYTPYAGGGLGIIARRGVAGNEVGTRNSVERIVASSPMRLLKLLPELHPTFDYALSNVLELSCAPGDMHIVAVNEGPTGEVVDKEGTAALDALWASLPAEIGGFYGLQRQLTQEGTLTGLVFVEAVPGPRMTGLARVWPVDSLTIGFRRGDGDDLVPRQRQVYFKDGVSKDGFLDLSPETNFWRAVNPMVDDPYGRPDYGVAINECLRDIAMIKDLTEAIHVTGTPRLAQGFNFKEMISLAILPAEEGGGGLTMEEAGAWAQEQFDLVVSKSAELRADDQIFHDSNADVKVLDGAKGMTGLAEILVILRQRVSQSLKTPGTMLGISDGATDTFSTKELEIYAARLETRRGLVAEVLYSVAALHLRLLGRTSKPKVRTKPIRATDALAAAQTEAAHIANVERKVANGWISPEDGSIEITGSAPFDPDRAANAGMQAQTGPVAGQTPPGQPQPVTFRRGGRPAKAAA